MVVVMSVSESGDVAVEVGGLEDVVIEGKIEDVTDGALLFPDDDSQDATSTATPIVARYIHRLTRAECPFWRSEATTNVPPNAGSESRHKACKRCVKRR